MHVRGIVLRREIRLAPWDVPASAADGKRLSAAETGGEPGLFFEASDGFSGLSPEDALPFSAGRAEALLAAAPGEAGGARLVTGNAVRVAALVEGGGAPEAGTRCRVRITGADGPCEALVEAADENAVLLRITEEPEFLCRVRFVEGTIEK